MKSESTEVVRGIEGRKAGEREERKEERRERDCEKEGRGKERMVGGREGKRGTNQREGLDEVLKETRSWTLKYARISPLHQNQEANNNNISKLNKILQFR